jgi:uncharacterized protein (TIGR02145 family)
MFPQLLNNQQTNGEYMKKKQWLSWILAGVVTSILITQISAMAADNKVVVIPLWSSSGDKIPTVTSKTGRVWMDRNLGAYRVAESIIDYQAYGWLYQWGRLADGHEIRSSSTTSSLSFGNVPGHGYFISPTAAPYDWTNPPNDNLWQGATGINNPCPAGFRVPTQEEWLTERGTWSSKDSAGAFASPLKLVTTGYRDFSSDGTVLNVDNGLYWSSTVVGSKARYLYFDDGSYFMLDSNRANGLTVRCLKD